MISSSLPHLRPSFLLPHQTKMTLQYPHTVHQQASDYISQLTHDREKNHAVRVLFLVSPAYYYSSEVIRIFSICIALPESPVSTNTPVTTIGPCSIGTGLMTNAPLPLTKPAMRDSKS